MRKLTYTVEPEMDGKTVYQYLKYHKGLSSKLIVKLKKYDSGIHVQGVHARTIDVLHAGDLVELRIHDAQPGILPLRTVSVEVLYENGDVIVYNKPPLMPCHPSKNHQEDTLANVFAAHMEELGQTATFRCINRLDRDTTGAVVVAKNRFSAAKLTGNVEKIYVAVVEGTMEKSEGAVEAPIYRPDPHKTIRTVAPEGQYAKTNYTVLRKGKTHSVVQCVLETGRTHQIRVHMKSLGYPLAGDDMYGGDRTKIGRQALHCERATFPNPEDGKPISVFAPLFPDMQQLLDTIDWE